MNIKIIDDYVLESYELYQKTNSPRTVIVQDREINKMNFITQLLLDNLSQKILLLSYERAEIKKLVKHINNLKDVNQNEIVEPMTKADIISLNSTNYYNWKLTNSFQKLYLDSHYYKWILDKQNHAQISSYDLIIVDFGNTVLSMTDLDKKLNSLNLGYNVKIIAFTRKLFANDNERENTMSIIDAHCLKYEETQAQKINELICVINNIKRLPKVNEFVFSDGTDMSRFLSYLRANIQKIGDKTELSEKERIDIKSLTNLNNTLQKYVDINAPKLSINEKTEQLIEIINNIKRLPKVKKGDKAEFLLSDGTNARNFYHKMTKSHEIIERKKGDKVTLSANDLYLEKNYKEIQEALWQAAFFHVKNFYYVRGNLYVPNKYIIDNISLQTFDMRKWLNEQILNYYNEEKSEEQLNHENQLFSLCPTWYEAEFPDSKIIKNTNTQQSLSPKIKLKK